MTAICLKAKLNWPQPWVAWSWSFKIQQ